MARVKRVSPINQEQFIERLIATAPNAQRAHAIERVYREYYGIHDGALGIMCELWLGCENSRTKEWCASAGKIDAKVRYNGKLVSVESKCNGGRWTGYDEKARAYNRPMIYFLCMENSTGEYFITPRIFKTGDAIEFAKANGLWHEVKNSRSGDGYNIQCSSRKWWDWLESQTEYKFDMEWA